MNRDRIVGLLVAFGILLFAAATLAHNLIFFRQYCFSGYDLGIYMEAVQKFNWSNWNPFLSTRGVGFLNDHWHPALILAKIFALLFSTSTSLFLTEIFFVVATALVPFYLVKKGLLRADLAALIVLYLVLDQRVFESTLAFPVHPSVWANFFLLLATALIIQKGKDGAVYSLLFLAGFFGEQFSLCLAGYSLVVLSFSQRKSVHFFAFGFSLLWVWFCLSGRSYLIGPILHQTDRVAWGLQGFISKYTWQRGQFKNLAKFFIEFLPILFVAVKSRRFLHLEKVPGLLIAGIFLPLVLGRILSGSFGHQYDTLLVTAVAAFALWLFARSERLSLSPGFLTGALFFFCIVSFSKFDQAYEVITGSKLQSCVRSHDVRSVESVRIRGLSEAFADASITHPRVIFAQGNLIPTLVEKFPQAEVICLGMPSRGSEVPDWIITERGACGDPWPFDVQTLESKRQALLLQFPALSQVKQSDCLFSAHK